MIPGLTIPERAETNGHTYREQLDLEQREPWVKSWAARYLAGSERLRAWIAAGRPAAIRTELCVVGDRAIVDVVRSVVAKLPEAVAHHVVSNVAVFCSGVSTRGFCHTPLVLPCAEPMVVVLAVADPAVVAHELGHAWHLRGLPPGARLNAEQNERLAAAVAELAVEEGRVDQVVEEDLQMERAADALARAWGFEVDTTSGCRGDRRRRRMRRDLDRRAAMFATVAADEGHNG